MRVLTRRAHPLRMEELSPFDDLFTVLSPWNDILVPGQPCRSTLRICNLGDKSDGLLCGICPVSRLAAPWPNFLRYGKVANWALLIRWQQASNSQHHWDTTRNALERSRNAWASIWFEEEVMDIFASVSWILGHMRSTEEEKGVQSSSTWLPGSSDTVASTDNEFSMEWGYHSLREGLK